MSSLESRKKQLLEELQSYKNDRIRLRDNTVSAIIAKRDQQITLTNVKLQKDLESADKEISSLHKKAKPEFTVFPHKKTAQKSKRGKKFETRSSRSKKTASEFKWSKFFFVLIFLPFYVIIILIRFIIFLFRRAGVKRYNKKIERKISSMKNKKAGLIGVTHSKIKLLEKQASKDSETAREEAKRDIKLKEKKIEDEILSMEETYNKEVDFFAGKFIGNPSKISPMIDHIISVFKSMDSAVKYEPLIISDLKFEVSKEQLILDFDNHDSKSGGKKTQEKSRNMLFFKEGGLNLTKDSECEGMAKALALISKKKLEEMSPTMMVSFDQNNATVVIHTKDINPNGRLL